MKWLLAAWVALVATAIGATLSGCAATTVHSAQVVAIQPSDDKESLKLFYIRVNEAGQESALICRPNNDTVCRLLKAGDGITFEVRETGYMSVVILTSTDGKVLPPD